MPDPVIVIGGGLAGLAAAARLAKAGHLVELYERSDTLGGSWAPYRLLSGRIVDDAPAIIGFPAPWRDLFRKSGRPLEAELARMGYALVPAEPPNMIFADGAELTLPTDRGGQYTTLADAYGRQVAERWQQLLDRLGEVWQTLRGLGVEAELRGRRQLDRATIQIPARAESDARRPRRLDWSPASRSPDPQRGVPFRLGARMHSGIRSRRALPEPHVRALADPTTRHRFLTRGGPILSSRRSAGSALDASQGAGPPRLFRRRRHDQEWPGRGGHQQRRIPESRCGDCVLRPVANVQHIAADHRGPADPTRATPAGSGSCSDDHSPRNASPSGTSHGERCAQRGWRANRELPTPDRWRRSPQRPRLQSDTPPALLRGGLERLLQLATPTSGDDRDSRSLRGGALLARRSGPIPCRALRGSRGVRLPRLPACHCLSGGGQRPRQLWGPRQLPYT